jgi:hypothetical protein
VPFKFVTRERRGSGFSAVRQPPHQRRAVRRNARDAPPGRGEVREQRHGAFRHVEADGVAGAAGGAGIVGQEDREAALRRRRPLQADEGGDAVGHRGDTARLGAVDEGGEAELRVRRRRVLEGERTGEDAAVELRQHHVHRHVGGGEAAPAFAPGTAPGGGNDRLQHRHAGGVEHGRLARLAGGERRGGDDRRRGEPSESLGDEGLRARFLEARDGERRRGEPPLRERPAQRRHRREIVGKQHRAVEDHRHDRPAGRQRREEVVERNRPALRQPGGGSRDRDGGRNEAAVRRRLRRQPPQLTGEVSQVVRAALAEVGEQHRQLLGRQGGELGEARVIAVIAGEHGERQRRAAGSRPLGRQGHEALGAVAPPVEATEQPHDDDPRRGGDPLQPEVHRHRVAEIAQRREAEGEFGRCGPAITAGCASGDVSLG